MAQKGWGIAERLLLEVIDRKSFDEPADWGALLPETLEAPFTTSDLAEATGLGRELAQKMAYCLRAVGVIELSGKRGRAPPYVRNGGYDLP